MSHLPGHRPPPHPPTPAKVATFFGRTWNDLLFPLLLLKTDVDKILPLTLLKFRGQSPTGYPLLFSGVIAATIPMIMAYVLLQRYFIEGATIGYVKGYRPQRLVRGKTVSIDPVRQHAPQ